MRRKDRFHISLIDQEEVHRKWLLLFIHSKNQFWVLTLLLNAVQRVKEMILFLVDVVRHWFGER